MRHRTILVLAASVVLATGCKRRDEAGAAAAFTPPPTPVEVAVVEPMGMSDRFAALGTVEAAELVTIASEISGRVVDMPFREGADVRRGQILVRLDASQLAADVQRADALATNARSTLERSRRMVEEKIASAQVLDNVEAAMRVAEADSALARARLAKTTIVAPFGGVVGARLLSPGAFVTPGQAITQLASVDEIKVTFSAPERFLPTLSAGREVSIATTAWPDSPLVGRIEVVDPVLDPSTRTARIVARAANPERRLKPGMSADVSVVIADRPSALTIPAEAVFFEGDQALVYLVGDDGVVARTPVTLGTRRSDAVEITSGLSAGQRVVSAGHQKLFPGAKVQAVDASAPPAGAPAGN